MIRWLPKLSVKRPVTITMVFLSLCVLGMMAWDRIPLEMMPGRFQASTLWVYVPYSGATPQENESAILLPVEEQFSTLPGLKEMSGNANSNSVNFSLEFHRSISMGEAYNAVSDRIERVMPDLPTDVDRYYIYRFDPSEMPIIWAGVSLDEDIDYPYQLAEEVIKAQIERVEGVGQVDVWGADPRRVFVDFSLDSLMEHSISLYSVIQSLGSDNFQLASGRITDQGQLRYVRSLARYRTIDELRNTPIGPGLVLDDIATVSHRVDLSASINRINGKEGIGLAITKESTANTVATARAVQAVFQDLESDPRMQNTRFISFFDQGQVIESSIGDLIKTAAFGGLFAIIVLFMFLRQWRMTFLIAACIPVTILLTVTVIYFNGGSLNLLSMMGLMIAVGMVVDNSIVVVESIYSRRQRGDNAKAAAIDGANEVGLAITLSTLTTMVVFLPVILMSENADFSFFMGELGMPVVWALAASLLVALGFTPLTTTLLTSTTNAFTDPKWIVALGRQYRRWLSWILTRRSDTLTGLFVITVITFVIPIKSVDCSNDNDGNIGEFAIRYSVPGNFTYPERVNVVNTYETYVESHREEWGVEVYRSRLRGSSTYGRTYVHLSDDRPKGMLSKEAVVERASAQLPQMAGVQSQIGWSGDGDRQQFRMVLRGEETAKLAQLGEQAQRVIRAVPGVISVVPELEEEGGEEMRLSVDRSATARHQLSAQRIGRTVSFALRGTPLPDYHDNGMELDVYARFRLEDRADLSRLMDFPINADDGTVVPLRALVHSEVAPGMGTIHRTNRRTSWPITVNVTPGWEISDVRANVDAALTQMAMPRGYQWDQPSMWADMENDRAQQLALILSITMVFLIMGVLFESFILPLSIITTIPMALFGVYWTLYLTNTPLDAMGGVGLIILIGVVVNNGIVFIDLVTRLREGGTPRNEALIEAGVRRMRPILMTALTTIFGLLPMAIGQSSLVGIPYAPMGRVVAGGLAAGTVLTLFLVPYLYSILDDIRLSASRWAAWTVDKPLHNDLQAGK